MSEEGPVTTAEDTGTFVPSSKSHSDTMWLMNSEASSHMINNKELFVDYQELEKPDLGDGHSVQAVGVRKVHLNTKFRVSVSCTKCYM